LISGKNVDPFSNMAGSGAANGSGNGEMSKRQAKLQKRMEKGDGRVQKKVR